MIYADLHIHSMYSDGTMTIEEILEQAYTHQVSLLAVSDHDMLDGARYLQDQVTNNKKYANIKCIPAVEINALDNGRNVHILGYYVDLENKEFNTFIQKNRAMLDDVSIQLIRKMEKDYANIFLEEFRHYTYDRTKGGFEALHYLKEKGFIQGLKEGFRFYETYDCPYSCVDFLDVPSVIEKVHEAGGIAVLAHPGVTIPETEPEAFKKQLLRYLDMGVEGIECYYPLHPQWMEEMCVEICKEKDLFITAGSDCHGGFGNAKIGETQTPVSAVNLTAPK